MSEFNQHCGASTVLEDAPLYTRERQTLFQLIGNCLKDNSDTTTTSSSTTTTTTARRTTTGSNHNLILISGLSGAGKTHLARSLKDEFEEKYNGVFLEGKIDQIQKSNPFVQVLENYAEYLIEKGDDCQRTKKVVQTELGTDLQLLVDTIPSYGRLFGSFGATSHDAELVSSHDRDNTTQSVEMKERFSRVLRHLLRTTCSRTNPFLLFLDDLQWASTAMMDLLTQVVMDAEIEGLVLLGACREVTGDHNLSKYLRCLDENDVIIHDVVLSNLSLDDLNNHISTMLMTKESETIGLSDALFVYTGGNIFFIHQVVAMLLDEKMLFRDGDNRWCWSDKKILERLQCSDILQFVLDKIRRLSPRTKEVLKVATCLGATFDTNILIAALSREYVQDLQTALLEARDKNFFVRKKETTWSFIHDKIQQAAYSLILEKSVYHLAIGRRLLRRLCHQSVGAHLLLVASQIRLGVQLITDEGERLEVAELLLRAGKAACALSLFEDASQFLKDGISILPRDRWISQYDLTLELYNAAAEVEYVQADFDRLGSIIKEVLTNARSLDDKLRCYTMKVLWMGSQNKLHTAIKEALSVLEKIGEPLPRKVSSTRIKVEYHQTRRMMNKLSDRTFLSLPLLRDVRKLAAMRLIILLASYCFWTGGNLMSLIPFRLVKLTIKDGLCSMSSVGLALYGCVLCMVGDINAGVRLGKLALAVVEKFNAKEWSCRVTTLVASNIMNWNTQPNDLARPLERASRTGFDTGDIEFALLSMGLLAFQDFDSGRIPLKDVLASFRRMLKLSKRHQQRAVGYLFQPAAQGVSNLLGASDGEPWLLSGEFMDEPKFLKRKKVNERAIGIIFLLKCFIAFTHGRIDLAAKFMSQMLQSTTLENSMHLSFIAFQLFLESGICLLSTRPKFRKAKHLLRGLRRLALYNPNSLMSKVYLIEGEMAAQRGQFQTALVKFESANGMAVKEGALSIHAMTLERMSALMHRHGRVEQGIRYLVGARALYQEWGYAVKVSALDDVLPTAQRRVPVLSVVSENPTDTSSHSDSSL